MVIPSAICMFSMNTFFNSRHLFKPGGTIWDASLIKAHLHSGIIISASKRRLFANLPCSLCCLHAAFHPGRLSEFTREEPAPGTNNRNGILPHLRFISNSKRRNTRLNFFRLLDYTSLSQYGNAM